MRKWGALLLALALCLGMTACGDAAARVVATVGDTKITSAEAAVIYEFIAKQQVTYYAQNGYSLDLTNKEIIASLKSETLNYITQNVAIEKKLAEMGLALTEEERNEVTAEAETEYEAMIQEMVSYYGMTDAEARTEADAEGYSLEAHKYIMVANANGNRLFDAAVADVTVTDENIQAEYDHLVADATEAYAATPAQFGTDLLGGTVVYARPEGYRYIKNLVIGLPEEITTQISEKQDAQFEAWYNNYMLNSQLASDTTLDEAGKADLQAQIDTASADYTRLQEEIDALTKEGQDAVLPKAEEVLALCKAEGADFDALLAEYGEDTATSESIIKNGYPVSAVSTSFVAAFTEGAMALENVGDVSDLVISTYGYHILKYAGDVEPGAVPLDEVLEEVSAHALEAKQNEVFQAQMEAWMTAYNIKTYTSRLTVK